MRDFLTYVGLFTAIVFFIWLFSFFYKKSLRKAEREYSDKRLKKQKTEDGGVDFVRCPLCNTPLAHGEDMVSRVFRPMNTPDQRMNVMGCPHCYPHPERGAERRCPVCGKEVLPEGYLIARLFNRSDTKKHVMIMGCTNCMKG